MLRNIDNQLHKLTQIRPRRRLVYGGMELIRAENPLPWNRRSTERYADTWHLPGGELVKTDELIRRAGRHNVSILIFE